MIFFPISDIHLESFREYRPPIQPNEKDINLLLAGDICEIDKLSILMPFINDMSQRYKNVVYIPGNHEFYHGHLTISLTKFREAINGQFDNVHFLSNEHVNIDGVNIVGTTLWTGFNRGDPMAMWDVERNLNDYRLIRTSNYQRIKAVNTYNEHIKALEYLKKTFHELKGQRNMVMSHHAPSPLSIAEAYKNDPLNPGFVSDLSELIADLEPLAWVHGHVHNSFDYDLYGCRVVCNPRGYQFYRMGRPENEAFSESLLVQI